jgi:hypothetical protein
MHAYIVARDVGNGRSERKKKDKHTYTFLLFDHGNLFIVLSLVGSQLYQILSWMWSWMIQ